MAAPSTNNYLSQSIIALRDASAGVDQWEYVSQIADRRFYIQMPFNTDTKAALQSLNRSIFAIAGCLKEIRREIPDSTKPGQKQAAKLIKKDLLNTLNKLGDYFEYTATATLDELNSAANEMERLADDLRSTIDSQQPALQESTDIDNNTDGLATWFQGNTVHAPEGTTGVMQRITVRGTTIRGTGATQAHSNNHVYFYPHTSSTEAPGNDIAQSIMTSVLSRVSGTLERNGISLPLQAAGVDQMRQLIGTPSEISVSTSAPAPRTRVKNRRV